MQPFEEIPVLYLGVPCIDTFALWKHLPEYKFWKQFLPMVNVSWSEEFERRTAGSGRASALINWDFIDGVTAQKGGEQYQQALDVITNLIASSEGLLTSAQLAVILDLAHAVHHYRAQDHGRFPVRPNDPVWKVHHLLVEKWGHLVAVIEERRSKSCDFDLLSHSLIVSL